MLVAGGCTAIALDPPAGSCDAGSLLTVVRASTARYADVTIATAAGYTPNSPCESDVDGAAMGIHYTRVAASLDLDLDLAAPDILLYLPDDAGDLSLVGVEYVVPAWRDGEMTFDPDETPDGVWAPAPSLFCQPFDGPMAGHVPGQPWHYDLHVWLHHDNPRGPFAPYNPDLTCPEDE